MKVSPASSAASMQSALESLGGSGFQNQGWSDIVGRISKFTNQGLKPGANPSAQLRVELVSKVSESAVASMCKLQQNQ